MDFTDSPIEWENEFEEDNENERWLVKQNLMFLIDVSKEMFNSYNSTTYFETCVEFCTSVVMKLIRKSRNDKIGIMLFGTNNDKVSPKYINVLCEPAKKPNIELIKILNNLLKADTTTFGQSPILPLADALWYSNYLLKKCSENQSSSSIILLTCNDQPMIGTSKKRCILRKRLDDVIKNNIDLKLIPIGTTFNTKMFYEDILHDFNDIIKPISGLEDVDTILSLIDENMKHGRSVSKLKFFIDDSNYISTSLFNFYTKSKIPARVKLDKRTNKPLTSDTQVFTVDSNELMYPSDLRKYCDISNQKIILSNEDISILKSNIMEPGTIKLLGFTKKEKHLISYHFKTSTFIHPNDKEVEGSSIFFNSLLENCKEMNKIIICLLKIRVGGRCHLAALVPQDEILDEYGLQKYPCGFHVIYLPFSECIRPVNPKQHINDLPELTELQVNLGKLICQKMSIDYYPKIIKNPKIDFHWTMLEAMALELEPPENLSDETRPANDVIEKNLNIIKDDVIQHLFPKSVSKKRVKSSYVKKENKKNKQN